MPIINPPQVAAGSEQLSSNINDPINVIADLVNGSLDSQNLAPGAVTSTQIAPGAINNPNMLSGAVVNGGSNIVDRSITNSKLDYTTFPTVVTVNFNNVNNFANTTMQTFQTLTASGLVAGWTYLVLVNFGVFLTNLTGTALADVTNIGMPQGRIRGGVSQSTPCYPLIYTATAPTVSMSLEGYVSAGNATIELPSVKFIPLYKSS